MMILFCGISMVAVGQQAKPSRNIVYKEVEEGRALELEIFEPTEQLEEGGKLSCVVFFYGGGWVNGTTRQFHEQAAYFSDLGMLAICADYRTKRSHGTTPYEAVSDAKSAMAWVRENADKLGVDPQKVIAAGGSAGGHLAACAGMYNTGDSINAVPNAMVLYNPVLDTTEKGYGASKMREDKEELSPCHLVQEGIAPTLVLHGTADKIVPYENAERFTALMKAAKNDCTLVSVPDAGHGFFNNLTFRKNNKQEDYDQGIKATEEFFRRLGFLPAE